MKKILAAAVILLSVNACTDDFEEINRNPKLATEVPAQTLLSNAQKEFADVLTSPNVNTNIFRLLSQQWAQTTYTDESRYDLNTRNIPQNIWTIIYRDVLKDLRTARELTNEEATLNSDVKDNRLAILELQEIYAWSVLVNTFGDIPYTEALNPDNTYPKYDNAKAIYNDLFDRLNAAIALMKPSAGSFGSADLVYDGNVAQWMKFANSLKLKLAMTVVEAEPARAKQLVEEAADKVFESNADNAVFQYLSAPPNTNPVWVDLVQSGRKDFVVANTLVDRMKALNDPRMGSYFAQTVIVGDDPTTPNVNEEVKGYLGGVYGASNNYATYSKPASALLSPDYPSVMLSYSEVEFYLAEAAARGFNVPGTAQENYRQAITASMNFWGVTDNAAIESYLSQPEVAFDAAQYKQKIGVQKWISLYNRGYDAWVEWRRLDYPQLAVPADAILNYIPVRYPYPVVEQNLNTANYKAAAAAVGGDQASTKIFWDVN
ncbi:SusD/RagB family nutrient-binding outer membrane lipoprotein [Pontibacter sp. CAU 1760]